MNLFTTINTPQSIFNSLSDPHFAVVCSITQREGSSLIQLETNFLYHKDHTDPRHINAHGVTVQEYFRACHGSVLDLNRSLEYHIATAERECQAWLKRVRDAVGVAA